MSHYHTLGIAPQADAATIKRAYRQLVKQYHPDVNPSAEASVKLRQIIVAYDVLSDPGARRRYDIELMYRVRSPQPTTHAEAPQADNPLRRPGYYNYVEDAKRFADWDFEPEASRDFFLPLYWHWLPWYHYLWALGLIALWVWLWQQQRGWVWLAGVFVVVELILSSFALQYIASTPNTRIRLSDTILVHSLSLVLAGLASLLVHTVYGWIS